jgi:hypothetical protein
MSPGHSEIMSPGVPTSCRLVERRPAGGWFLPSSGVLVNPLRLISVGFAAGRWNPAIAIAYGAPRAIRESAADMAATVHYAVDRSGFRRHTGPSPTRAAPHSSLEVSVPVPAQNRRALQRGCHLCSDTALSGWDRQFESAFLQRGVLCAHAARPRSMKLLKPSGSPVLNAIQRGMSTPPNSQAVLMQ